MGGGTVELAEAAHAPRRRDEGRGLGVHEKNKKRGGKSTRATDTHDHKAQSNDATNNSSTFVLWSTTRTRLDKQRGHVGDGA